MKRIFLLFLILSAGWANAATGCVANSDNSIIYLEKAGPNYKKVGATWPLEPGCSWIFIGGTCTINGGIGAGLLAQDNPQECDIDTNVLMLIFGSVVFGAFMLRKKRDTNFIFGSK